MEWAYGKIMYEQEDIDSLDEWSDDLEVACSIMDERFDYMWTKEGKGIRFTDRLLNDDLADRTVQERLKRGEAVLKFGNFEDVFRWILNRTDKDLPYHDWMVKRLEEVK